MWHVLFFHLYCCWGLDKGVSMPVSEKGSGRVQRAPSNLMAGLSIEHVGVGDQESDTTFSQMLPLGVASHPEWRSTRLQALTPPYHNGMEAGRKRPARHVMLEGWGLTLLGGECCDYLTMTLGAQQITKLPNEYVCFQMFYFNSHNKINFGVRTKSRTLIAERKIPQQLTQMLSKKNGAFFRQEAPKSSKTVWKSSFGQKPLKMYFLQVWQEKKMSLFFFLNHLIGSNMP